MRFRNCLCGPLLLWPDDIRAQPVLIVIHAVGKDCIEDDLLAAYRYYGLLALERILLLGRVIVVQLSKLGIALFMKLNLNSNCIFLFRNYSKQISDH